MKNPLYPLLACLALLAGSCRSPHATPKQKLMWLDCSANWQRFSDPDSIRHYAAKCREAGITDLVLDLKCPSGEVVYPSSEAPQIKVWKGFERPDFDFVGTFIEAARANGLGIYGSFNTFAEGHGIFRRGPIYDRPEWEAVNYVPGRGLLRQSEIPGKSILFANPALPEVQEHEIAVFREAAARYDLDGILLDRARYDNIQSDFSDFSRRAFEAYVGEPLERFPEDIYTWEADGEGGWKRREGRWFRKWIEWRASVIHGFFARTRGGARRSRPEAEVRRLHRRMVPLLLRGWGSTGPPPPTTLRRSSTGRRPSTATTATPTCWTSTPTATTTGPSPSREYRSRNAAHRNETDSEVQHGDHLSVEGGCRYSRRLLGGHPFIGGMYVEDYRRDTVQFKRAVEMNLRESDGVMIFDIVHIIDRDWWGPLRRAIAAAETTQNETH